MNKRGFLRIVEASISIVIILGVLFVFFTQVSEPANIDFSERARDILEEIAKENSLREVIVGYNTGSDSIPVELEDFVNERIPESFLDFEVRICEIDGACGISNFVEGNVYSAERVLSSTLTSDEARKVRLFIWEVG